MPQDELVIRVKLNGARQYASDATVVAASTEKIGRSANVAATGMNNAHKKGFLLNQTLFTARRYLYAATLGFTAAAGASVIMGIKFNAAMEQNRVAFEMFLRGKDGRGGVQAANKELDFLFKLAATTPFEFPWLVNAARSFLAVGFKVQEVNGMLKVLADTAAAFGLQQEGIDRMTLAFSQMLATGRVLGGELRQLEQLGIPARNLLRQQLGLTADEMKRIGDLGIPAKTGIVAILQGLQQMPGIAGASARQARTLNGQLSTLHDNFSQLMGEATKGFTERLRTQIVPGLNDLVNEMRDAFATGGGWDQAIKVMDQHFHAGGKIVQVWNTLKQIFHTATVLIGFMAAHIKVILFLFKLWLALWVAERVILIGVNTQKRITLILDKSIATWTTINSFRKKDLARSTALLTWATRIYTAAVYGEIQAQNGQFVSITRTQMAVLRLRGAYLGFAATLGVSGGVLGAIIIAITALFTASIYAFIHFRRWRKEIGLLTISFSPLLGVIELLITQVDRLRRVGSWLWGHAKGLGGWLGGGWHRGFANGGRGISGGWGVVGERGPELMRIPAGSDIHPLGPSPLPLAAGVEAVVEVPAIFKVDSKVFAQSMARVRLTQKARS